MDQFTNKEKSVVTEAFDGVMKASGGLLARFDGYPHNWVVVRSDLGKSKVALVYGGGYGHDLVHVGCVGLGMLTVAVYGDAFAPP